MMREKKLFKPLIDAGLPDLRGLLLVVLVGGWLAGMLLASTLALSPIILLLVAVSALLITVLFWHRPAVRVGGLALFCLCLGAWRYTAASPLGDPHAIRYLVGAGKLEIQGSLVDEPRLESHSTLLTIAVQQVSRDRGKNWQEAYGEMQVQALGATFADPYAPRYGDSVQLFGSLAAPPSYSTSEIQASMAFPIVAIRSRSGNPLLVMLYQFRDMLAGSIMQALPQPFAALLIAIFLSLRTPALKPLIPLFNVTGTAHLIAPSGFKVTILAGLISGGTGWLQPRRGARDWRLLPAERHRGNERRWLRSALIVLCIIVYTFLSGAGPAAIRAGIMGILLILAPRLGRFYNVYTALALTALLMSLVDPFILWDTGFQLSFLGTLGIVFFTPFFQRPLRFLTRLPLGHSIAEIIAVTLAAQIATLPIFALSFHQVSFVAPLANIASVPLLSVLLGLGMLICLGGLFSAQLALLCGWIAWPLLWYIVMAISWCASLPGAYLVVSALNPLAAWTYYLLLVVGGIFLFTRWGHASTEKHARVAPLFSRKTRRLLQWSLALLVILATGALAVSAAPDGHLSITVLTAGSGSQGAALLVRTPDGQSALINEGADSATLAETLDTHLPAWQRSLNLVVLSDPDTNNLAGLQDIVTRYQVGRVIDGGMLHPNLAYARWRSTLVTRNLPYTQVRQGAQIALGSQVVLQILWPPAQLHRGSNETRDNALVLRLQAPGLNMLLLDAAALSSYALQSLATSVAPAALPAGIVQIADEQGKAVSTALAPVLTRIHPALLLVTAFPARKSKKTTLNVGATPSNALPSGPWEVLQGQQIDALVIQSDLHGWRFT